MPCDSSYMEADGFERKMSKVCSLLDELDGQPINKSHWHGYHPRAYNCGLSRAEGDVLVAELCSKLQKVDDVSRLSLEMQMWWRNHQEADRLRLMAEQARAKTEAQRAAALAKLSPYEKQLLGIR